MAGNLNVDYGDLRDVATTLGTEAETLALLLKQAKDVVTDLVGKGFRTDQASVALQDQVDTMTLDLGKSVGALENYGEFLRKAAQAYQDADDQLATELGGSGYTSRITVNLPELDDLKANLKTTSTALHRVTKVNNILDSGVVGDHELAETIKDFSEDWDKKRTEMTKAVDELYKGYETIVTTLTDLDTQLKSSLTQKGASA